MPRATLRERLRYRFDSFMSRGGSSIFISLTVIFIGLLSLIVLIRAATYTLFTEAPSQHGRTFFDNLYITFLQMTDPGNMAQDIGSSAWFKVSAVLAGLVGVVLLSMLIAFITTALDRMLQELRKGNSTVIEEEHTLILGWNEQRVVEILRELVLANESEDDPAVVLLADVEKEHMDDYLRVHCPDLMNTRVVTRSGTPSSLVSLRIASV